MGITYKSYGNTKSNCDANRNRDSYPRADGSRKEPIGEPNTGITYSACQTWSNSKNEERSTADPSNLSITTAANSTSDEAVTKTDP
jgi:hypothetical protein